MSLITYPVLFDGTDLQSVAGITVLATDPYKPAKRKLGSYDLARSNRSTHTSGYYMTKEIVVKVAAQGLTRALAETALDNLLAILQEREKQLILLQGSAGRRVYTASLSDTVTVEGGGSYIEVDLIFECTDRFGYDYDYTLLVNVTGITSASRQDSVSFGGSAPTQAPHVEVQLTAVSAAGEASITIGNSSTGQAITVTRTWAQYDLLAVDVRNKTVQVNGNDVEFTGAFPEFKRGSQTLYVTTEDFTSHTYKLFAYYHKRYI